ncbi:RBPJ-interacting and tubulin-associated protein 1 [Apodemus speciosus]|uniref:RBPJ-interacting and tubulin-associated protein 1 n=1 Tax=Apodemus speciosus TaxID=105296 RepID=A0ABQ0ESS3_APOSI
MQALHLQHRSPSSYRVKASASYVDETLFGSPTGTRPSLPDFDPPWVQSRNRSGPGPPKVSPTKKVCESPSSRGSTPNLTPRKKNKYRLIGHTPSYCDESLFGTSRQGSRTAVEDAAKLRTLFWTPQPPPGAATHLAPGRPHCEPFTPLDPPGQSPEWPQAPRCPREGWVFPALWDRGAPIPSPT